MRFEKKILLLFIGLTILLGVSSLISLSLSFILTEIPFWILTFGVASTIFLINFFFDHYRETKVIKAELEKYNQKPYKEVYIDVSCQYCGHKESVTLELDSMEYNCSSCKKKNAIYANFFTAAITEPNNVIIE